MQPTNKYKKEVGLGVKALKAHSVMWGVLLPETTILARQCELGTT